jgi:light-harvesting protein B-800-850 beta chain
MCQRKMTSKPIAGLTALDSPAVVVMTAPVRVQHEEEVFQRRNAMADPNKVWPTGLTEAESEEIHRNLIQGTQIFGMIAVLAHLLAYIYSPWLH